MSDSVGKRQIPLSNRNNKVPAIGMGLWRLKDEDSFTDAFRWALESGYRHFDTAQMYKNERLLGKAIKASDIDRNELFITTKIHPDTMWWVDLVPSFKDSLEALQMDYVDLLLLHFPVTELRRPAWQRMQELARDGRAKAIGVSNYTISHLRELLDECEIKPVVNQVELHVYLQQPELLAFCRANDIMVEAYSPLAHGYGLDNPLLAQIGRKHGKSPAQVMIRWCIEQGTIPLPKSMHEQRIKENMAVFDFSLDAETCQASGHLIRTIVPHGTRHTWDEQCGATSPVSLIEKNKTLLPITGLLSASVVVKSFATLVWGSGRETVPSWISCIVHPVGAVLPRTP